ncbi:hypothetical protein KIPB_006716 [Kipferlia bialata]|uniref:Uncharacterized protein n=1 Tax=Kipferlia bialata TaxID=797122 RepID=A0A391NS59_9EUKA|nr:hypothetical protein KIPB_006716 [Kipferlia bialata]|eukprot:g6716.t1
MVLDFTRLVPESATGLTVAQFCRWDSKLVLSTVDVVFGRDENGTTPLMPAPVKLHVISPDSVEVHTIQPPRNGLWPEPTLCFCMGVLDGTLVVSGGYSSVGFRFGPPEVVGLGLHSGMWTFDLHAEAWQRTQLPLAHTVSHDPMTLTARIPFCRQSDTLTCLYECVVENISLPGTVTYDSVLYTDTDSGLIRSLQATVEVGSLICLFVTEHYGDRHWNTVYMFDPVSGDATPYAVRSTHPFLSQDLTVFP